MDRLNICIVVGEDWLDRFEPVVRHLCVGMIDEAIATTIVGPESPALNALAMGPVRVCTYRKLSGWGGKSEVSRLTEAVAEQGPHLVHAMSTDISWLGAHLAHSQDVPLVVSVTGRGEVTPETEPILKTASKLIAVSDPVRTDVLQRLQRSAHEVIRIRWGLLAGQEPACFSVHEKSPTLITVSPLTRDSGVDHLIEAMARLSAASQPLMLFILGTGPAEGSLRQRANALGLNEQITFAGNVREWPTILAGADIFVLPARQQILRIHPIAAMAAGLVVLSVRGGAHDCLIDSQTARLYEPPGAEMLAAVLAELLGNPDQSRRLAASAQEYIRQHHRVSAMVSETVQIYRQLTLNQKTIPMPTPNERRDDDTISPP